MAEGAGIHVDISKAEEFFQRFPEEMRIAATAGMELALADLQRQVQVNIASPTRGRPFPAMAKGARGGLHGSIMTEIRGSPGEGIRGLVFAQPPADTYVAVVELGRRAAPAPVLPIRIWLRSKPGLQQLVSQAAARIAQARARARRRKGRPARRKAGKHSPQVQAEISLAHAIIRNMAKRPRQGHFMFLRALATQQENVTNKIQLAISRAIETLQSREAKP